MVLGAGRAEKKVDEEFKSLTQYIEKHLKIQCSNYKEDYIKRRLMSRMNATKIASYREYLSHITTSQEERELLKNALTINVTKFFRDPEVFEVIRRDILPQILKEKRRIRIWSAGCSSGEEPYTLAIILSELALINRDLDGFIYATDIDDEILKRAKEGIYEKQALENLSAHQINRHFTTRPDGKFEVKPHVREKVRLQHHDLMSGMPVARYLDMITCRNVTIYFNESQKNAVARTFHEGLASGGYYIMGMSEYLGREVEHLFKSYRPLQKVFIRAELKGAESMERKTHSST
ncbi:MAG: protein-glutamate O-methyltransferase CheR [Methanomicrobiales archaeon]|nr:protein-glutamate O-methyltransferase CheR [Methanomicrobiales archaeon]